MMIFMSLVSKSYEALELSSRGEFPWLFEKSNILTLRLGDLTFAGINFINKR